MAFESGHALIIGVGTYKEIPQADLPIMVADARSVSQVLRNPELCGYPLDQVTLLHDQDANRETILAALDSLAQKASEGDTVLLYYCGHGDYGSDGDYYLTTHDSQESGGKLVQGTGIREAELLDKLRAIPARRLLLLFNACHSGEISPSLGLGAEKGSFGGASLPTGSSEAILSTGEGRIIITACRESQKSWVGHGELTIFTQALVDGLSGKGGVWNNNGYVSAFALYEHVYGAVTKAIGGFQEPELTVLKGVGPFPVSLYRGASSLGPFDDQEAIPAEMAVHDVDEATSKRQFERRIRNISLTASGDHASANYFEHVSGGVQIGDEVHGDKVMGDKVSGDKIGGDKITVGDISGSSGIAIGRGARAELHQGISGAELNRLFQPLLQAVQEAPPENRQEAAQKVDELEQEVAKGNAADDSKVAGLVDDVVKAAPAAAGIITSIFKNPAVAAAAGSVTQYVLNRIGG